ncbi:MAG TPA: histidine kinase [Capillimicrobium sp.]|nr:histidine kinase [Capillimicrobium sp.]
MCISPPSSVGRPPRRRAASLLWWVVMVNVTVLGASALLLIATPVRITPKIAAAEAAIVIAGFLAMAALSLVMLRGVLAPLRRLAGVMAEVEPLSPGRRLDERDARYAEVITVTRAFNAMLDRLEDERRSSTRRVLEAQEAERIRIARELHDDIGQTLTATAIEAERAAGDGDDPRAQALRRAANAVRASLDDVRRIARELRPEALDDLGLVNALISLCRRVEAQSGRPVRIRAAEALPALPAETELVLYRVAQESLTNVIRHANARDAELSLTADGRWVTLVVADDGEGLGPAAAAESGTGIAGMRERALLVGGRLQLRPRRGGGTEVVLDVPVGER